MCLGKLIVKMNFLLFTQSFSYTLYSYLTFKKLEIIWVNFKNTFDYNFKVSKLILLQNKISSQRTWNTFLLEVFSKNFRINTNTNQLLGFSTFLINFSSALTSNEQKFNFYFYCDKHLNSFLNKAMSSSGIFNKFSFSWSHFLINISNINFKSEINLFTQDFYLQNTQVFANINLSRSYPSYCLFEINS